MNADTVTDVFQEHRSLRMEVAHRMLGRVAAAQDVVQGAWLRGSRADRAEVREPRGYLVRITTRPAIDRLCRVKTRGEACTGPWLPEPYVTESGDTLPDRADRAHRPGPRGPRPARRLRLPRRAGRPGVAVAAGAGRLRPPGGVRLPVRRDRRPARPG